MNKTQESRKLVAAYLRDEISHGELVKELNKLKFGVKKKNKILDEFIACFFYPDACIGETVDQNRVWHWAKKNKDAVIDALEYHEEPHKDWLVWGDAWLGHDGYTEDIMEACLFTLDDAREICGRLNEYHLKGKPPAVMVNQYDIRGFARKLEAGRIIFYET